MLVLILVMLSWLEDTLGAVAGDGYDNILCELLRRLSMWI